MLNPRREVEIYVWYGDILPNLNRAQSEVALIGLGDTWILYFRVSPEDIRLRPPREGDIGAYFPQTWIPPGIWVFIDLDQGIAISYNGRRVRQWMGSTYGLVPDPTAWVFQDSEWSNIWGWISIWFEWVRGSERQTWVPQLVRVYRNVQFPTGDPMGVIGSINENLGQIKVKRGKFTLPVEVLSTRRTTIVPDIRVQLEDIYGITYKAYVDNIQGREINFSLESPFTGTIYLGTEPQLVRE